MRWVAGRALLCRTSLAELRDRFFCHRSTTQINQLISGDDPDVDVGTVS